MKKLLSCLTMMFLITGFAMAQSAETDAKVDGPIMTLETATVDYGEIVQSSDPLRTVKFTNTGNEPLIISNAKGTCGCTVPKWPDKPVMPGESAKLEIRYDTKRIGTINKAVKIYTNVSDEPIVVRVVGKVIPKESEEALPEKKGSIFKKSEGN